MKLYEFAIRRVVLMFFVLLAVSLIIFYLTRAVLPPTTAAAPYITPRMNDEMKLNVAVSLGLATPSCPSWEAFSTSQAGCVMPVWGQYVGWLRNVLQGNWGYTLLPGISGTETTWYVFASKFPYTAQIAIAGGLLTILIGIPLGIISAAHNNKWPDHVSRIISIGGYSMPTFWFGLLLQLMFALYIRINGFGLLPSNGVLDASCAICVANPGQISVFTGAPILDSLLSGNLPYFWDAMIALFLPAVTLAITSIGALTRIVRSSMMEVLRQDYILLARSKGLRERVVIYRHALKNALLPAMTISGLIIASLLGGVVVIEIIFSLPGVGNAALVASEVLDLNFLELYVLVTAAIIVIVNLIVDLTYAKLDPRIRY